MGPRFNRYRRFTDGKTVLIKDGPVEATESPVHALTDAPEYVLSGKKPDWLDRVQNEDPAGLPLPDASPDEVLLRMLASPNIASKRAVFRQYDHQVQNNTVIPPGGDAALLRVKGTARRLPSPSIATDASATSIHMPAA